MRGRLGRMKDAARGLFSGPWLNKRSVHNDIALAETPNHKGTVFTFFGEASSVM